MQPKIYLIYKNLKYFAGHDWGPEAFIMLKKLIMHPEAVQTSLLKGLGLVKHKNTQ